MARVFVTGATGFIGGHLVRQLHQNGDDITCLVRRSSDCSRLALFGPRFVIGDVTELASLEAALDDAEVVYHLAGATKSLQLSDLESANIDGARNVARACALQRTPPTLVHVSSLAAAGPTTGDRPLRETDKPEPVSIYGHSKLAGEYAMEEYSSEVPITVVRPPIVLGEGDRDGLRMFASIARWNVHFVPGMSDERFSVIHGDDLATALILASRHGRRLDPLLETSGIYFASSDEFPTYAELGQMIGRAVGHDHTRVLRNPKLAVWAIAAVNELAGQLRRRAHILGLDKAREATAGSWVCSSQSLFNDTGFKPACCLQERLEQTARWYANEGWLPKESHGTKSSRSRQASLQHVGV